MAQRPGRPARQLRGQVDRGLVDVVVGHHPVHQPPLFGFGGRQDPVGEGQVEHAAQADVAGHEIRGGAVGGHPGPGVGHRVLGRFARDHEVEGAHEAHARPARSAAHTGHERLRGLVHLMDRGVEVLQHHMGVAGQVGAPAGEFLQVAAATEDPAFGGHGDGLHVVVVGDVHHHPPQVATQGRVDGIGPVGTVEVQQAHTVADLVGDGLELHGRTVVRRAIGDPIRGGGTDRVGCSRETVVVTEPSESDRSAHRGALVGPLDSRPEHRRIADRVAAMQAEHDRHFDATVDGLLTQLDVSDGHVIVMTFDTRFAPLFENWAASCDRADIAVRGRTLVFPTDAVACERAESLGFVASFDPSSPLLASMGRSAVYGDPRWTEYMHHQNWVIQRTLHLGLAVLFQDADVVWRRDPTPALAQRAAVGTHLQAMYDGPNPRFRPLHANSGFLYFADAEPVREFWTEVYRRADLVARYRSQQEPLTLLQRPRTRRDEPPPPRE